ncbi:MAG: hypothetical protein SGJ13_03410 [Actinomycetota bacterium]|nr:hypothetical protein [Actinomycetota bacterium]
MAASTSGTRRSDSASEKPAKKMLLDDLVADTADTDEDRAPAGSELTLQPVPVAALAAARKRRRVNELEEAAVHNLKAAEEARKVALEDRKRLGVETSTRRKIQREATRLRRELDRLRETEQKRTAQAKFAAEREARREVQDEVERVKDEHVRVAQEVDRLRHALDDDRRLMEEFTERLREEQRAKIEAKIQLEQTFELYKQLERNMEHAVESVQRRAEDELARLSAAETAVREAQADRDRVAEELAEIAASGGGQTRELQAQVRELEASLVAAGEEAQLIVGELESRLIAAAEGREDETGRVSQLERALSDVQSQLRDADTELRRLQDAASDEARAVETGRAEIQTALHARIAELETEVVASRADAETVLHARIAELEAEAVTTRAEADDLRVTVGALENRWAEATADAEEVRAQFADLEDVVTATADAATRVREDAEEAREALRAELASIIDGEVDVRRSAMSELSSLAGRDTLVGHIGDVRDGH